MKSEMATVLREGAKALPLPQLLNSYFEILSNPEECGDGEVAQRGKRPVSRTWVGAGWGRGQQPWHSPRRLLKTASNLVLEDTSFRGTRGRRGIQSRPGRGPRAGWGEDPCTGTRGL